LFLCLTSYRKKTAACSKLPSRGNCKKPYLRTQQRDRRGRELSLDHAIMITLDRVSRIGSVIT